MSQLNVNSPIEQGGILEASFSGFAAYSVVHIFVEGGGGLNVTANSAGSGSVRFYLGEPPGNYTLVAEGGGYSARANFQVIPGGGGDLGPGQFRGQISNVELPEGVNQQSPLNFKVSYRASTSVVTANMGWETRITCEYAGQIVEQVRRHYGSTDVGGYMTLQAGMAPSVDTDYQVKLYAREIDGSWNILASQPVKVKGSGIVAGDGGDGGSFFDAFKDIPKPVLWIGAAAIAAVIFWPSKKRKSDYE
jgi:hypothetical protein